MKRFIICDFARSNWGKTQTLLNVIDLFKKTNLPVIEEVIGNNDKYAKFEINNKTIVINTQGDPRSYQEEGLKRAIQENTDIIICASRSKGETIDSVYNTTGFGYEIIWFSNLYADADGSSYISLLHKTTAEAIVHLALYLL